MAVKVTLKTRDKHSMELTVDSFNGAKDEYYERSDGKLEVHKEDGTIKTYQADAWSTVEGNRQPPDF